MKNSNVFNKELPQETVSEVLALIKQIEDKLKAYMISLTVEDRKRLAKLGNKRMAFVVKAMEYALLHPEFIPAGASIEDMQIDSKGRDSMLQILRPLEILQSRLDDTLMRTSSELLRACLDYADSVKGASSRNVQAAKVIEENLSAFFKKTSRFDDIEESPDDTGKSDN